LLLLAAPVAHAGQFKVTWVYDGDTIKAEGHDIEIKVRLVGIGAPETSKNKREEGQPYSQRPKDYLTDLILDKTVDIQGYGLDRYSRVLGVVSLNERNINIEMVKSGYAEVYRGLAPHKFDLIPYWQAEKEAKETKLGMWSLGDKYVSPKDWRKGLRER
jgi:endonuclease YncB( thermonuclease family)